jgi:leucyl-tRNA synthetase
MEYSFSEIENQIQQFWKEQNIYKVEIDKSKPKYYILDMFPYPSGAGLHVGHPLGYIASDILARYKRLNGFNVLHPMGYDSFGLPAEQYAIQTGQHPAVTTEQNLKRYREQLDKIGFSFDWSREVKTSDPKYYKWTQWIFIQLYKSWYNKKSDKAESIDSLIEKFKANGSKEVEAHSSEYISFSNEEWNSWNEKQQQEMLLNFRLAYLADSWVNWCPALGTVLANDEVKDGVSERGGYPVEQRLMKQWSLRITAYAQRLLDGLNDIDWSESIKESQRNWIGRSEGAYVDFKIKDSNHSIKVFTTRPDTIFGVTFMVLAPEHELVDIITTAEQKEKIESYKKKASAKSERERNADVKNVSGEFTGAYVEHPFTGKDISIYIADYVLATYGTGAVMAVPSGDVRDFRFANHFNLPIVNVFEGVDVSKEAYDSKEGKIANSDFLNGLEVKPAMKKAIEEINKKGIGVGKINYRLRDAIFGRQRYWGEPIPVYYKDGLPYVMDEKDLPLVLPEIDKYLPTEAGDPPLARAKDWKYKNEFEFELTTMPGWAGSSWYFLRYMNSNNENEFAEKEALDYWKEIDFYLGGSEHATGHLLYFRFWTKFLKDIGVINIDEPAKKLVNQGMIQGVSAVIFRSSKDKNLFYGINDNGHEEWLERDSTGQQYETVVQGIYIDINTLEGERISLLKFKEQSDELNDAKFFDNKNYLKPKRIIEKMSKSKYNVVNPDDMINEYGADCFRMYEMFLGPIEQSKPWDTKGIDGTARFLRKLWRLFYTEEGKFLINEEEPTKDELKILHKTIKKIHEDMERLAFNTSVSAFMICMNEFSNLKCSKKKIVEPLLIILHPYAPFITEYLWKQLGNNSSILNSTFPKADDSILIENNFEYPVSVNGKMRTKINLPLELQQAEVEKEILALEPLVKWMEGKPAKKIIYVKGRMINVVV